MDKKTEALAILEEGINALESNKGSVTIGVQKLARASHLLDENQIYAWTQVQLGNNKYSKPLYDLYDLLLKLINEANKEGKKADIEDKRIIDAKEECFKLNIPFEKMNELLAYKTKISSGGKKSIDFIEQRLNEFSKDKNGNDGVLYRSDLNEHLVYVKRICHEYTSILIDKIKYSGTIKSSFDLLKEAVDDKLLEIDPELSEQLMLAFKSISSNNPEEWSQALTTCRRLLEKLADNLYPSTDKTVNGRTFKQNQYINRLWQFMDEAIESKTNKDLAKTHVDYLGSWLQKDYTATCKGVHSEVNQLEATKFVFHMYLLLADLIEYLDGSFTTTVKPYIKTVSLDEIEALLNIKRSVAKEIIKARVKNNGLTLKQLGEVAGVGKKTIEKAKEEFEF